MSVPLLSRFFPVSLNLPAATATPVRWCPKCEQLELHYHHTRRDRAFWRCKACRYEVNFPAPVAAARDQTCGLVWKGVVSLGVLCVMLSYANHWEAKLRSQHGSNAIHPLPSFKDLR